MPEAGWQNEAMTEPRFVARPDWYTTDAPQPLMATGRPLRWGVVATGNIAGTVTGDLALLEDAVLQAVSSRSAEKAAQFASRFGFADHYYDDGGIPGYQRLVQDPEVDVVYVATPHAQHFTVAKAALEAGKHVLCEKAFTINAREAAELIRLATRARAVPDGGRLVPLCSGHAARLQHHRLGRDRQGSVGQGRFGLPGTG